jgi:hypothetical protein
MGTLSHPQSIVKRNLTWSVDYGTVGFVNDGEPMETFERFTFGSMALVSAGFFWAMAFGWEVPPSFANSSAFLALFFASVARYKQVGK